MTTEEPSPPSEPGPQLGGWSMLRSPAAALALATSGVDWICLDAQHGEHDDASVREVCALLAGCAGATRVLVRPPSNDAAWIGRALDSGADGVIVPLVDTPQQAAAAVAACRYPPHGRRSWGPLGGLYGVQPPTADVARARCAVMVETAGALAVVDEIAAIPGLDEIFVGPFDLSLTLGTTVDDLVTASGPDDPLPRIVAAAHRAGITVSAFGATAARSAALLALGFDGVAVTTDVAALGLGVAGELSRTHPA